MEVSERAECLHRKTCKSVKKTRWAAVVFYSGGENKLQLPMEKSQIKKRQLPTQWVTADFFPYTASIYPYTHTDGEHIKPKIFGGLQIKNWDINFLFTNGNNNWNEKSIITNWVRG